MDETYELSSMDWASFEHLVNALALNELGPGLLSLGKGADGGRDGFFEGKAPYPSAEEQWNGTWYIQSKHRHLSTAGDQHKWLVDQVKNEISQFKTSDRREWPDNWILATNIDPSGVPQTGAFDAARALVKAASPKTKFHIWGGAHIARLLTRAPAVANKYRHLMTPGHVVAAILDRLQGEEAKAAAAVIRALVVRPLLEHRYTKLEQAGSSEDERPGLHQVFSDLPLACKEHDFTGDVLATLACAASESLRPSIESSPNSERAYWKKHPKRARTWFLRGGPGQGKSTVAQFICQIHRASLIQESDMVVTAQQSALAKEIVDAAGRFGASTKEPRIPVWIDLKDYATWFGEQASGRGIISYIAYRTAKVAEVEVGVSTLRKLFEQRSWMFCFDGLDEVPQDVKDGVGDEVTHFIENVLVEQNCDALSLCTSRPQRYSGQFDELDAALCVLDHLNPEQAQRCAAPILTWLRSEEDSTRAMSALEQSMQNEAVRQLMRTPLQAHIVAVIIRDGGRPPERRWGLFSTFYETIKRREVNRHLPERDVANLLAKEDLLLRTLHSRVGMMLHASAEQSKGAQTSISRDQFIKIAADTIHDLRDGASSSLTETLARAAKDRLVLLNTPDDGAWMRFDVRQLQEYFAGEQLYVGVDADLLSDRVGVVVGDAHWQEVMHFMMSALIEQNRRTEVNLLAQLLCSLDEGVGDCPTLDRKLARGALIAFRLLKEGVLEQDKRMRGLFVKAVDALCGWCNGAVTDLLRAPAETRLWITSLFAQRTKEMNISETSGAWIFLLTECSLTSELRADVINRFLDVPDTLQESVMSAIASADTVDPFCGALGDLLDSENWKRIYPGALRVISEHIRNMQPSKMTAETSNRFRLARMLNQTMYDTFEEIEDSSFGGTRLLAATRASVLLAKASMVKSMTYDSKPHWAILDKILLWIKSPSLDTYLSAREEMRGCELSVEALLPRTMQQIFPKEEMERATNDTWTSLYKRWGEERAHIEVSFDTGGPSLEPGQLEELAKRWDKWVAVYPPWGQYMLGLTRVFVGPEEASTATFVEFAKIAVARPDIGGCAPYLWKAIFAAAAPTPAQRSALMRASAVNRRHWPWEVEFEPIPLSLPEDEHLLPTLCGVLRDQFGRYASAVEGKTLLEGCGLTAPVLRQFSRSGASRNHIAASMLLLLVDGDLSSDLTSAVKKLTAEDQKWTLEMVADLSVVAGCVHRHSVRTLVESLLSEIRGRREWYEIEFRMDNWRQISSSPMTSAPSTDSYLR